MTTKETKDDYETKRSVFDLNRETIPLKIACFLAGGVLGAHATFLNVFFVSLGLPKILAGIMTGLTYAAPILSGPLWGYLSDKTGRRRLILGVICVGAAGPIFSTPWVARYIYPQSKFNCSDYTVGKNMNFTSNDLGLFANFEECENMRDEAMQMLFKILLPIMVFASVFLVPLQPYVDSIVATAVKKSKSGANFGTQRIFGCIGKVLITFVAGKAAYYFKYQDLSPFTAAFFILVPMAVLLIPVGCQILTNGSDETKCNDNCSDDSETDEIRKDVEQSKDSGNAGQILKLCCKPDVILFLMTVLIVGMAHAVVLNFSYIYVLEDMNRSKLEMTLVIIVSTTSEAIVFPLTSNLIRFLKGTRISIIIGVFAQAVRFLIMSQDITFEVFVALQTLSGLGFALSLSAMMERSHKITPKHLQMSMSTIVTTLFFIAAAFVVSIAGAKVYEWIGGKGLFFSTALLCGVWGVVILLYNGLVTMKRKQKKRRFVKKDVTAKGEIAPLSSA